jgi:hypothetical protein
MQQQINATETGAYNAIKEAAIIRIAEK